ncbi:MAG: hypothetical protein GQF41_1011 [Candidatus Rifleibacterium amylolyticum]|nr:MAG: hypothetical protein GQF41_1011 [Candidatus Rifleibacterium amylolyticum]
MVFSLKRVLVALLLSVLTALVFFLGLTVSSNLAFTRFIQIDQKESIVLGRQYERLMDVWSELGELRSEAFLAARPIEADIFRKSLESISGLEAILTQASKGTSHETEWLKTREYLSMYVSEIKRFDGLLALWAGEMAARKKDQEEFVKASIPRLDNLTQIIENTQTLIKGRSQKTGSDSQVLLDTISELNANFLALKDYYSPVQISKLNQPEISRLETLIEKRLDDFTRTMETGFAASGLLVEHSLQAEVVDDISQFGREFSLLQSVARNRNIALLEIENEIHELNQSLRLLRNAGMKICLDESDLIWQEIEQDSGNLLNQIQSRFYSRIVFLTIAIAMLILGLIKIPDAIAGPLDHLRKNFSRVTPGRENPGDVSSWIREITELNNSFQQMVSHINEATNLQTRYFETLTRIPSAFSSLYQTENTKQEKPYFKQQLALTQLFPLLTHQMKSLSAGQIFWKSNEKWVPCGSPQFSAEFLARDDDSRIVAGSLTDLFNNSTFIEWAGKHSISKPIVIGASPGENDSEVRLIQCFEIPSTVRHDCSAQVSFSGICLSSASEATLNADNTGFLLLCFVNPASTTFSRADQVFVSVIAQQMSAMMLSTELFMAFQANQQIAIQLELAKEIQQQALPGTIPTSDTIELQAAIRMASEVGGDFYDFISLPNGSMGILIADVSGKNVPAALLTMALKSAIYSLPVESMCPSDLVNKLNIVLFNICGGEHFVTLTYGVLDPANSELTLCNAGHVPTLHFSTTSDGTSVWKEHVFIDFPLGIFEHTYTEHKISIQPGDRIIFYTDGITDCKNASGKRLEESGFKAILNDYPGASIDEIMVEFDKFRKQAPLSDDITLLSVVLKAKITA